MRYIPLMLQRSARTWLNSLPPESINSWLDFEEVFNCNFTGTYLRPGNAQLLALCKQKTDESYRAYLTRGPAYATHLKESRKSRPSKTSLKVAATGRYSDSLGYTEAGSRSVGIKPKTWVVSYHIQIWWEVERFFKLFSEISFQLSKCQK